MSRSLTLRQEAFIAAYLGDARGVGRTAARMAGYQGKPATLDVTASDLLSNPKVAAAVEAGKARIRAEGIASREARIAAQQARWLAQHQIVAERATAHAGEAPGAGTGWLVKQVKVIGAGEHATTIEEWAYDKGLDDAMRANETLTAKELGQHTEKREITGPGGGPIETRSRVDYAALSLEDLHALESIARRTAGSGDDSAGTVPPEPA